MNPGISEEVGTTARSFIDAMKSQPFMLACATVNFILLGLIFYIAHGTHETRQREVGLIYENQKSIQDLIIRACISRDGPRLQSDESKPVDLPPLKRSPK
jgi:hypothetical protein